MFDSENYQTFQAQANRTIGAPGHILRSNKPLSKSRPQTPTSNYIPSRNNNYNWNMGGQIKQIPSNIGGHSRMMGRANSSYSRNNISKSRASVSSASSQLGLQDNQIFSEDLIFLLKSEDKNINNFKQKIQRQKSRVQNDFAILRAELQHLLEDAKISIQAELDLVYTTFIGKYAQIKSQMQELRKLRKQILTTNSQCNSTSPVLTDYSNKDLIQEIEKDAENVRNFRIYGYLTEMQKQKLNPIVQLSNDLVLIGSANCPFYRSNQMGAKLNEVKIGFSQLLRDIYKRLPEFVVTPQSIIQKEREQNNAHSETDIYQPFRDRTPDTASYFPGKNSPKHSATYSKHPSNSPQKYPEYKKPQVQVSQTQQGLVTRFLEDLTLQQQRRVNTDHSSSILCLQFINNKYIATGSKDKSINIYDLQGRKIVTLKGHSASICSMASVKNFNGEVFLASGGDHGCSALMLWDTLSWVIQAKVQGHGAAVTGIVDLRDGRHIATGSYDKMINIYNHAKKQMKWAISNNRTSITAMVLSGHGDRLVTSGLDNSIAIWSIVRHGQIVEGIKSQGTITNNSLVCQMQPSILRGDIIVFATKDGLLKTLNLKTGLTQKSYVVNNNSIIELALLQREAKPDTPLVLSCSSKDQSLVLTRLDNGISSFVKMASRLGIEFGCGIGPKIVFSENGILAVLNQSNNCRQFTLYGMFFQ